MFYMRIGYVNNQEQKKFCYYLLKTKTNDDPGSLNIQTANGQTTYKNRILAHDLEQNAQERNSLCTKSNLGSWPAVGQTPETLVTTQEA